MPFKNEDENRKYNTIWSRERRRKLYAMGLTSSGTKRKAKEKLDTMDLKALEDPEIAKGRNIQWKSSGVSDLVSTPENETPSKRS